MRLAAASAVWAACGAASAAAQDPREPREPAAAIEIDRLLASIGERELRIDLLAWRLAETPPAREAARLRLFGELATLAGEWLAESDPPSRRGRLARIEAIAAAAASPREAEALRWEIAIHQGLAAAEEAERWRRRSRFHPDHADRPAAEGELRAWFERSGTTLEEGLARREASRRELADRLRRTSGIEADRLAERQLALATDSQRGRFLAAWAWLGLAMLDADHAAAARAERLLQPMLDAGEDPAPVEVSMDRRGDPAFCRAILGMAVARSLARSHDEGRRWLALLEAPIVPAEIAEAIPWWSVELAIVAGDPDGLEAVLAATGDRLPIRGLERAAAAAIDAAATDARWRSAADAAVAALLARGAIAEVRLLTPASSTGVGDADAARNDLSLAIGCLHAAASGEEPRKAALALLAASTSLELPAAAAAALAAEAIERALRAGVDGGVLAAAAASERFEAAPPPLRERLAWLRLASLDRAEGDDPGRRWSDAAREHLAAHPQGEGASLLRLRLDGPRLSAREIADLAVAGESGAFGEAIGTLARQLLRARLADPDGTDRRESAEAMIRLARIPRSSADPTRAAEACWDRAEALLALGDPASRAEAAVLLAGCGERGEAASGGGASAGDQRRWRLWAELHLAMDDLPAAIRAVRQAGGAEAPRWWGRRLAAAWRSSPQRRDLGEALLASIASDEREPALLMAASRAAEQAWLAEPTRPHALRWLAFAERAAAEPSAEAVDAIARAAAAAGAWPAALAASRERLARLPAGSDGWLDAKRLQLASLAELDPPRARAVLRQHQALRPQWRSQRHGEWFESLDRRLGEAAP